MKNKSKRLVALALRLAYHVTKTPQDVMTDGKTSDDQLWSVMPDVPSSSSEYKPVSRHKSRDDAVRAMKNMDKKDLSEKIQKKEQDTEVDSDTADRLDALVDRSQGELQRPSEEKAEPVIRSAPPKRMQPDETGEDFEPPKEKVDPVIRAKPPEGMTPDEQADAEPKRQGEK